MRILSGIQPSGALHIGNYFGALRQFIDLQRENDAYYFVANYHALTSVRDPALLRKYVFDVLVDLLALGLDPERATPREERETRGARVSRIPPGHACKSHKAILELVNKGKQPQRYKMLKASTAVRPNHTKPARYAQRKAAS